MGTMNRAQRRQQERQQIRDWRQKGQMGQVLHLSQNGITEQDLDKSYKLGYDEGYMTASKGFFKQMYAACAMELIDAGNGRDDVVSFLQGVDHRFAVMFDADDEIQAVYDKIGVRLNVAQDEMNRIQEVRQ